MKFLTWYSTILVSFCELTWLALAGSDDEILWVMLFFAPVVAYLWITALKPIKK